MDLHWDLRRYAWVCRDKFCKKVDKVRGVQPNEDPLPMDVCKLNCGRGGTLWPLPTGKVNSTLKKTLFLIKRNFNKKK